MASRIGIEKWHWARSTGNVIAHRIGILGNGEERVSTMAKATRKTASQLKKTSVQTAEPLASTSEATKWTFLTNHSHVLILLAQDSEMVLRQVALKIGITERAVQRIIADLEEGGFVVRERIGRRNRYQINSQAPLRHPIEAHRTIGDLLSLVNDD